ncbi:MAG: VOC family protein [Sphaerochaeta sp.]|nr:VOC family protein [Sphaerochaeta sp.]
MNIRFAHVNLISRSWRSLADFYIAVFDCVEYGPVRDLQGEWVDRLSGLEHAHITGVHLALSGFDPPDGPTLEIFSYDECHQVSEKPINGEGYGHIAFAVDDVPLCIARLLDHGGSLVGEYVHAHVAGAGDISVVYARDPEGNIIEIQRWG